MSFRFILEFISLSSFFYFFSFLVSFFFTFSVIQCVQNIYLWIQSVGLKEVAIIYFAHRSENSLPKTYISYFITSPDFFQKNILVLVLFSSVVPFISPNSSRYIFVLISVVFLTITVFSVLISCQVSFCIIYILIMLPTNYSLIQLYFLQPSIYSKQGTKFWIQRNSMLLATGI